MLLILLSQAEQRKIKDHLRSAESRITKVQAEIQEEYRRLNDANGGLHARRLAELEQTKTDVEGARFQLDNHENGLSVLETRRAHAEREYNNSQPPINAKRSEKEQCEERLNSLMRDSGQRRGAYHQNMPRLISAIREDNAFLERPVGPLGNHIRLLKPLWSSILEKSFGALLTAFIVTSKEDQSRLSNLMQRIGWYGEI